ncbi:carbohydrate kinase family protein [Primorskyibacter sp. S187A]|uniref:carbohydrate kinase family protein n=1 Tax=Primorskyibacter sp. S187A TaxID=3415130 RepID=UPI003C7E0C68
MILCCGEALIDMLPRESAEGDLFLPAAGGAVFNTAIALGRLGAPSGYFGGLSTDLFGQQLCAALDASNVDHALCPRSAAPTTLAFVTLKDGHATYAFYDENTAGRSLTEADLPILPTSTGALFFGGISLVSEPAADTYAALCSRAGSRLVMIDPNIRPAFITDEARYRARLTEMLAHADVVKVSDEDLDWITGTDDPRGLLASEQGPAVILMTKGSEGATAYFADETLSLPAQTAQVVDTVGAGDTFNAGFLAGLAQASALSRSALTAQTVRPAMELAIKAAAVTVSRAAANPPWAHELA